MKNDIKKMAYSLEAKNKLESEKERRKREEKDYQEILNRTLDTSFFLNYENQQELNDFYFMMIDEKYNIIDNLAINIYNKLTIKEPDELDPTKEITKKKYNKSYEEIKKDLDLMYFDRLKKFVNEMMLKEEIRKKHLKDNIYNYIHNITRTLLNDDKDYILTFETMQKRDTIQVIKEDLKKFYNYNITVDEYLKIINSIKKMYNIDIIYQREKEKVISRVKPKKKKGILSNIPTSWKLFGILKLVNHKIKK